MLDRITELKAELNFIDRHKSILQSEKDEIKRLEEEKDNKLKILKKENEDVELLEKLSFRYLFHSLLGDKQEQLDFEKQEAMQASIDYRRVLNDYEYKVDYVSKLEKRINNEENIIHELTQLQAKLHVNNNEIINYRDNIIEIQSKLKEVNEALEMGTVAFDSLLAVQKSLKSANNWSTADILDVDFSGVIKRDYLRTAQKQAQVADNNIKNFERELNDVYIGDIDVPDINDFMFDIFFDNIFTDFAIKNRIKESLSKLSTTLNTIESVINGLKEQRLTLESQIKDNKDKLKQLLQEL